MPDCSMYVTARRLASISTGSVTSWNSTLNEKKTSARVVSPAMFMNRPMSSTIVQVFWVKLTTGTKAVRTFIMA